MDDLDALLDEVAADLGLGAFALAPVAAPPAAHSIADDPYETPT